MKVMFRWMLLLLSLDVGSKVWVREEVRLYDVTVLLPNFLELTHVQNKGVSFSFLSTLSDPIRLPLLIGISVIAITGMIFYQIRYWYQLDRYTKQGLAWIIPGAFGNLIDRVLYGYVTDFFHFRWYEMSLFVNNLADCFISIGVVYFLLSAIFGKVSVVHSQSSSNS